MIKKSGAEETLCRATAKAGKTHLAGGTAITFPTQKTCYRQMGLGLVTPIKMPLGPVPMKKLPKSTTLQPIAVETSFPVR